MLLTFLHKSKREETVAKCNHISISESFLFIITLFVYLMMLTHALPMLINICSGHLTVPNATPLVGACQSDRKRSIIDWPTVSKLPIQCLNSILFRGSHVPAVEAKWHRRSDGAYKRTDGETDDGHAISETSVMLGYLLVDPVPTLFRFEV